MGPSTSQCHGQPRSQWRTGPAPWPSRVTLLPSTYSSLPSPATSCPSFVLPFIQTGEGEIMEIIFYLIFFRPKSCRNMFISELILIIVIIIMTALMLDRTTASFMMATNTITMVLLLIPLQYIFLSLILLVLPPTVPKSCRKDQYQQQHQLRRLHQHLQKMIVLICQTQGLFLTMIVELAAMRQMTMAKH